MVMLFFTFIWKETGNLTKSKKKWGNNFLIIFLFGICIKSFTVYGILVKDDSYKNIKKYQKKQIKSFKSNYIGLKAFLSKLFDWSKNSEYEKTLYKKAHLCIQNGLYL